MFLGITVSFKLRIRLRNSVVEVAVFESSESDESSFCEPDVAGPILLVLVDLPGGLVPVGVSVLSTPFSLFEAFEAVSRAGEARGGGAGRFRGFWAIPWPWRLLPPATLRLFGPVDVSLSAMIPLTESSLCRNGSVRV